jgi:N-acetyl-gamma-glutamylphosphate reductase
MAELTVHSKGIYHGLPSFPEHEGKQYTAVIFGASGITGTHTVEILSQSPRWSKIIAVSRTVPHIPLPNHVTHLSIDLLDGRKEIERALEEHDIKAYV